jgi:predicted ATPase
MPRPALRGPLFGRDADLARLKELLAQGERLVTILGPPGVGKTRLALALCDATPGFLWCDLSDARTEEDAVVALCETLGVPERAVGGDPRRLARLVPPGDTLLVADNFEQLVEQAAKFVEAFLAAAPGLRIVVTSRRRLGLPPHEVVHELAPLALVGKADGEASPAMALFLHCARRIRPDFASTPESLRDSEELVRALEGSPLAIELAAARMQVLSPHDLALREPTETVLESTIARSWALLSSPQQRALSDCAVFCGGFTVPAAEAVLHFDEGTPVIDLLHSLRDASLLRVEGDGAHLRLGMHLAVRAFTARRASPEAVREAQERHARWCAGLAPGDLANEVENALAAIAFVRERGDLDLALRLLTALEPVLTTRGPIQPYLASLDDLVAARAGGAERSELLPVYMARAATLRAVGRVSDSRAEYERAARLAGAAGDTATLAEIRTHEGGLRMFMGDDQGAMEALQEALRLVRAFERPRLEALVRVHLGNAALQRVELDAAEEHLAVAREIARRSGDDELEARTTGYLGLLELDRGNLARARACVERAMAAIGAGHVRSRAYLLGYVGLVRHEAGEIEAARVAYLEALPLMTRHGDRRGEALLLAVLGAASAERGDLAEARARLEEAEEIAAATGDRNATWLVRYLHLTLHVAAAEAGDARALEIANRLRDEATSGAGSPALRSWDVRFALRLFARRASHKALAAGDGVLVSRDGAWFEVAGERVSLGKFRSLALLLACLAIARDRMPGRAISVDDLLAAGWPNERVKASAGANRVHVALAKLRRLGLRDALRREADGYLLHESAVVDRGTTG